MRVSHEIDGEQFVYEENFWSGKKKIYINGTLLTKISRNMYEYEGVQVPVSGNYLLGASIIYQGRTIELVEHPRWYEVLIHAVFFTILIVWGNSTVLVSIIPIVGGAIGGLVSVMSIYISITLAKNKTTGLKLLISLIGFLCAFALSALIGFLVIQIL